MSAIWMIWIALFGAGSQEETQETVTWYAGTSRVTSPDGRKPYGPPVDVLVKRVVQPAQNRILEIVHHPGQKFEAVMTRLEGTTKFSARDESRTWTGFLDYSGPEWNWDGWTYSVTMSDGSGTLTGRATMASGTLTTEKYFHDASGKRKAKITEEVKPITEKEYGERLAKMEKK